jgi:sporulation protein YlmC with PRC-barrel domain
MATQDVMTDKQIVMDDPHELISSRRVEGTPVYDTNEKKIGTIHSVMIEKRTGQVAYAIMSFGGFLGMAERAHPIPWDMLTYDVNVDGYIVNVTKDQLLAAPTLTYDETDRPRDRVHDEEVAGYYGRMPWWGL